MMCQEEHIARGGMKDWPAPIRTNQRENAFE